MFYDFLQDGFIDFAMEFYEDPLDFDINEAKARKAREEAGNDLEKQAQLDLDEANEKDGLLSDGNKKS